MRRPGGSVSMVFAFWLTAMFTGSRQVTWNSGNGRPATPVHCIVMPLVSFPIKGRADYALVVRSLKVVTNEFDAGKRRIGFPSADFSPCVAV